MISWRGYSLSEVRHELCQLVTKSDCDDTFVTSGSPDQGRRRSIVFVGMTVERIGHVLGVSFKPREGVELDRATLADWVCKTAALVSPLVEAVAQHVLAAEKLHADDTPVPVLAPARPRPDGYGCTCATSGPIVVTPRSGGAGEQLLQLASRKARRPTTTQPAWREAA